MKQNENFSCCENTCSLKLYIKQMVCVSEKTSEATYPEQKGFWYLGFDEEKE